MSTDIEIRRLQRQVRQLTAMVERLVEEKEKENNLITAAEFAKIAGCSRRTVLNRIKAGIYGAERHGKLWYLPRP